MEPINIKGDKSRIDRLKDRLYSPNNKDSIIDETEENRFTVHEEEKVSNNYAWPENKEIDIAKEHEKSVKFFKIFFISSVAFCLLAGLVAGFMFYSGLNKISSNNLDIKITSPVSVAGGEVLPLSLAIINENNIDLLDVVVYAEYPPGTKDVVGSDLLRDEMPLDDIKAFSQKSTKFEAILFGEENIVSDILITVKYRIDGGTTIYTKEKKHSVLLTKAPISLIVEHNKEINDGDNITFKISSISNSKTDLSNILLKVAYPIGFIPQNSNTPPMAGTNDTWLLNTFEPGEKKEIIISGIVRGQNSEEKVFRFFVGLPTDPDSKIVSTIFSSYLASLKIEKAFVDAKVSFENDLIKEERNAQFGDTVSGYINIRNNLPKELLDVAVELKPAVQFLDRGSTYGTGGFFQSSNNVIIWNKSTLSTLSSIKPDDTLKLRFNVKSIKAEDIQDQTIRNPQMPIDVVVTGRFINTDGTFQTVSVNSKANIKFNTTAKISGRTLYNTGPFTNTGPVPPKSEVKTTYTLHLSLTNTTNQISNGVLTARLPIYVQWLDNISPSSENVTYDPGSREIRWNVGELPAYAGSRAPSKEIYIGVELYPSVSQINQRPVLLNSINFSGVDRFTNTVIRLVSGNLTTDTADLSGGGLIRE